MSSSAIFKAIAALVVLMIVVGAGWLTRDSWMGWFIPPTEAGDDAKPAHAAGPDRVKLSEQAEKNIRLVVKDIEPATFWRKIYMPGSVIDRPGHSDRGIPAPIAGVVTQVFAVPGRMVRAGDELFRLRLVSESFQTSQMELFKSTRELEIVKKERSRLNSVGVAIPTSRLLELDYQHDRLKVLIHAYRQDLLTRQMTQEQLEGIEKGVFVTEAIIRMPDRFRLHAPGEAPETPSAEPIEYEVQELKVHLGDHVLAGQIMAYLSDHRLLYIEGKALKHEVRLLAKTVKERWPIEAEFSEDDADAPGEHVTDLKVEFLGSTMDANGMTLPVYIPFTNPHKEQMRHGRSLRVGQYRPGQKVLLKVAVAKIDGVFVVPLAGVVREGPEAYVFRQNGSVYDRRAVHVVAEDSESVAIADDGSIVRGNAIVQNAAAVLNRVLKASQADGGGGHHHHHDH